MISECPPQVMISEYPFPPPPPVKNSERSLSILSTVYDPLMSTSEGHHTGHGHIVLVNNLNKQYNEDLKIVD